MIIYKATNIVNGKVYIGKTKYTLETRKAEHLNKAKKQTKITKGIHTALKEYGSNNFKWEIIYQCNTIDELSPNEIRLIKEYGSYGDGYNLTPGGDGGYTYSDEVKLVIGEHTKLRNDKFGNPFKGKTHTDESKHIMSEKAKLRYQTNEHPLKGVPRTDDIKRVISDKVNEWLEFNEPTFKGKTHSMESKELMSKARIDWHESNNNGFKGKTHTDEVRKQISEKLKGRVSPNKDTELSETHRENLSKAQTEWLKNHDHPNKGKNWKHSKKREYTEVTCPYCGKIGKGPNMNRYHFANCKNEK